MGKSGRQSPVAGREGGSWGYYADRCRLLCGKAESHTHDSLVCYCRLFFFFKVELTYRVLPTSAAQRAFIVHPQVGAAGKPKLRGLRCGGTDCKQGLGFDKFS